MRTKVRNLTDLKAGPDDGLKDGEFLVYPSTFTRTPDAYGDVIAKGAFADSISQWKSSGNTLPGLYGHRLDDPDFYVASAREMGEDDHGWWVKGEFDLESPKGKQVYRLVKDRRLNQLSFAFDILEEGKTEGDDGEAMNELRKVHVHEFSFVPVGANQDTSVVAVKSPNDETLDRIEAAVNRLEAVSDRLDQMEFEFEFVDEDEDDEQPDEGDTEPADAKSVGESQVNRLAAQLDIRKRRARHG